MISGKTCCNDPDALVSAIASENGLVAQLLSSKSTPFYWAQNLLELWYSFKTHDFTYLTRQAFRYFIHDFNFQVFTTKIEVYYRISSYIFLPWIVSTAKIQSLHFATTIHFQFSKRTVSAETIWGNTVCEMGDHKI